MSEIETLAVAAHAQIRVKVADDWPRMVRMSVAGTTVGLDVYQLDALVDLLDSARLEIAR